MGENAFGAHFLQLYRKNECVEPHFVFHDFNEDIASFRWEKNWHKSMFSLLEILLNCTDWAITGRIARVQFNSTLERKIKTGTLKGIFLVCKWINNTINSNSVRYHMHHRKNGLRAVFDKGSKIAVFLSIVRARARWPPLFITFFYHYLDLLHQCTKFHLQSMLGSFTRSDSSDSYSMALTTPLTTTTPSLVKTSLEKAVVGLCQAVYLY